jgi:competence protein ComEA
MVINREPLKDWFGFTRRERRSSFILLLIIILIIALRYLIPEKNIAIEDISSNYLRIGYTDDYPGIDSVPAGQLFPLDPNTATFDTLLKPGLASKGAGTLIKYRNSGGKFRNHSDMNKIYGISGEKKKCLSPFVDVASDTSVKVRPHDHQQQMSVIDLNRCDSAMLVRLPGIGPVLSARIIKYRHLIGGFANLDQLKEVYGLPVETFDLIKTKIFVDTLLITRININSSAYKELIRLPYIERYEVISIMKYRELKGKITGIGDLIGNKLLPEDKALKIRPYIDFE